MRRWLALLLACSFVCWAVASRADAQGRSGKPAVTFGPATVVLTTDAHKSCNVWRLGCDVSSDGRRVRYELKGWR